MLIRAVPDTDPFRAYGVTHREYGGRFYDDLLLDIKSYGKLADGVYTPDPNIAGHLRVLAAAELVQMLVFGGVTQDAINAAVASGDFGNLVLANLMQLGPFLDHDNRWASVPTPPAE